jgi:hypothetical protein
MRGSLRITAGVLAVAWLTGTVSSGAAAEPADTASCGQYGTRVHFEKTPSDAARKALKEEKLVMVLHVSGDFENPEFT